MRAADSLGPRAALAATASERGRAPPALHQAERDRLHRPRVPRVRGGGAGARARESLHPGLRAEPRDPRGAPLLRARARVRGRRPRPRALRTLAAACADPDPALPHRHRGRNGRTELCLGPDRLPERCRAARRLLQLQRVRPLPRAPLRARAELHVPAPRQPAVRCARARGLAAAGRRALQGAERAGVRRAALRARAPPSSPPCETDCVRGCGATSRAW
jgi:hypothetical protein